MPFFFPFLLARGNIFPYGGRTSISFFKLIFIGVELLDHAGLVSALQQSESLILLLFRRSVMSRLFATPWTAAHQAPLSMGILQARILARIALPFSRGSSDPGIEPASFMLPALAGRFFTTNAAWEAQCHCSHTPEWVKTGTVGD